MIGDEYLIKGDQSESYCLFTCIVGRFVGFAMWRYMAPVKWIMRGVDGSVGCSNCKLRLESAQQLSRLQSEVVSRTCGGVTGTICRVYQTSTRPPIATPLRLIPAGSDTEPCLIARASNPIEIMRVRIDAVNCESRELSALSCSYSK